MVNIRFVATGFAFPKIQKKQKQRTTFICNKTENLCCYVFSKKKHVFLFVLYVFATLEQRIKLKIKIDILLPYKVDIANLLANNCLFVVLG